MHSFFMARYIITLFYNIVVIPILSVVLYVGAFFSAKFRARAQGIANTWRHFDSLKHTQNSSRHTIWFHAASAGEFEQIKPVIEHIRSLRSTITIIATLYSVSGYNAHREYPHCDAILFLPQDTWWSVRRFIREARIDCAVFSRYDLWWNMASALSEHAIPLIMINATLNPKSVQNRLSKLYHTLLYQHCTAIYTAGERDALLFRALGLSKVHSSADTRVDRIIDRVNAHRNDIHYTPLKQNNFTLIIGSSWGADEEYILPAVQALRLQGFRITLIIVPHEPTESHITSLEKKLPNAQRLSRLEALLSPSLNLGNEPTIIVDSIGKLLRLYAIADGAYIGGGFGFCVHSVLEPAGYGIALACGPNIELAQDAIALSQADALRIIHTTHDVQEWLLMLLTEPKKKARAEKTALAYVQSKHGISHTIAQEILFQLR